MSEFRKYTEFQAGVLVISQKEIKWNFKRMRILSKDAGCTLCEHNAIYLEENHNAVPLYFLYQLISS